MMGSPGHHHTLEVSPALSDEGQGQEERGWSEAGGYAWPGEDLCSSCLTQKVPQEGPHIQAALGQQERGSITCVPDPARQQAGLFPAQTAGWVVCSPSSSRIVESSSRSCRRRLGRAECTILPSRGRLLLRRSLTVRL